MERYSININRFAWPDPNADQKSEFWHNFIRAAEAEPRVATSIQGLSGFSHPVAAVGVDERRRRVIMISGESDARSAALAQGDIQAAMPSVKVVMARPLAINLGQLAKVISEVLDKTKIGTQELKWMTENEEEFKKKSVILGTSYITSVKHKIHLFNKRVKLIR